MEGGACQFRIEVRGEVSDLAEEGGVQGIDGRLQTLNGGEEILDDGAFGMESLIATGEVILNQFGQTPVMLLVGELLPRCEIKRGLIESSAQALAVLGDESGDKAAGNDGGDQQDSIEETLQESHGGGAPGEARTLTCDGGLWVVGVAESSTVKGKIQHWEISRRDLLGIALYASGV